MKYIVRFLVYYNADIVTDRYNKLIHCMARLHYSGMLLAILPLIWTWRPTLASPGLCINTKFSTLLTQPTTPHPTLHSRPLLAKVRPGQVRLVLMQ